VREVSYTESFSFAFLASPFSHKVLQHLSFDENNIARLERKLDVQLGYNKFSAGE
jgi:hypothetical protein